MADGKSKRVHVVDDAQISSIVAAVVTRLMHSDTFIAGLIHLVKTGGETENPEELRKHVRALFQSTLNETA